jgi:hypothetical protein
MLGSRRLSRAARREKEKLPPSYCAVAASWAIVLAIVEFPIPAPVQPEDATGSQIFVPVVDLLENGPSGS